MGLRLLCTLPLYRTSHPCALPARTWDVVTILLLPLLSHSGKLGQLGRGQIFVCGITEIYPPCYFLLEIKNISNNAEFCSRYGRNKPLEVSSAVSGWENKACTDIFQQKRMHVAL